MLKLSSQNFNGGSQASMSDIWSFMSSALAFVDDTDWMAGACPFGQCRSYHLHSPSLTRLNTLGILTDLQGVNEDNALLGSNDSPTDLGYFVINNGN